MDKQSLLDIMSQQGLPIKTPFGSVMEWLGIPQERLVDILSKPWLTLGKYPYPVPEQNVRPLAKMAATFLPYEITPQEAGIAAAFGGPSGKGKPPRFGEIGEAKLAGPKPPIAGKVGAMTPAVRDTRTGKIYPGETADVAHATIAERLNRESGLPFKNMESGWMKEGAYYSDIKSAAKPWSLTAEQYIAQKEKEIGGKLSGFERQTLAREHADLVKKAQERGLVEAPKPPVAKSGEPDIIDLMTRKTGAGEIPTGKTPRPEGGIKYQPLEPKDISEIASYLDYNLPQDALKYLRSKNIKFIDGYHVSNLDKFEHIKKKGITKSSHFKNPDAVYFIADKDDISQAIPFWANKIEGIEGGDVLVTHFQVPIEELKNMHWDGRFRIDTGAYSGFMIKKDILPEKIIDYEIFKVPSAADFKAGKKGIFEPYPSPSPPPSGGGGMSFNAAVKTARESIPAESFTKKVEKFRRSK